jgi:hypothetical protein
MAGHGEKLSRRQEQAIAALLTAPTVKAAAQAARVSEKTLRGWMCDEPFDAAYRAARRQAVDHAVTLLQRLCCRAVKTLARAMRSDNPNVQLRAATTVLEMAMRGVELGDLAAEVEALKQQQGARHHDPGDPPPDGGENAGGTPPTGPGTPPAGSSPSGPGGDLQGGGDGSGSVAREAAAIPLFPDAAALFPAERQESDGRRPGSA